MNRILLPTNSASVHDAIERGDLKAIRIGARVMVDSGDLAFYLERPRGTEDEGAR